jgi:hypothetical protein
MKTIPIAQIKRWWSKPSVKQEKGGNFNMDLYLRICDIKLNNYGQICKASNRKVS